MMILILSLALGVLSPQGSVREATIEGDIVRVGDLLTLEAWDARAGVELGRSPEPGRARKLHDYELVSKIRGAGFAADGLAIPSEILVRRASRRLDDAEIRSAIEAALDERFPESRTSILDLVVGAFDVTTAPIEISAALPDNFRSGSTTSVRVDIVGEEFSRTVHVRAVIALEVSQPVLRRDVAAQAVVLPTDVEWRTVPLESSSRPILDVEALGGYVAKHDLDAGSVLTEEMLYAPIMVRRGETVSVEARVGAVVIAAEMEARQSGKYGEVIEVAHTVGEGRTRVRIVGPGQVRTLQGESR